MPAAPSNAQQQWMELRYGLFIHFGPNTFTASGWGDGRFPAADFHATELSTDQWAELAAAAGMRYAVLTTKHHDGFCLWPSRVGESIPFLVENVRLLPGAHATSFSVRLSA